MKPKIIDSKVLGEVPAMQLFWMGMRGVTQLGGTASAPWRNIPGASLVIS